MDLKEVIQQADDLILKDEEFLVKLSGDHYSRALKLANSKLQETKDKGTSEEISNQVSKVFADEFVKLVPEIKKAMERGYQVGLKETGLILKEVKGA